MTRISRILCPIDFSLFSLRALDHAAALAASYGARLTVLHVYLERPNMDLPPMPLDERGRARLLDDMGRFTTHVPPAIPRVLQLREASSIHEAILSEAQEVEADLLVIGTHGSSGFERMLLGSVTEKVIRKAQCPTLVVPRQGDDVAADAALRFRRVLCPVDFSDSSLAALAYAIELAGDIDAHVTLLHVVEIPPPFFDYPSVRELNFERVQAAAEADARQRLFSQIPAHARSRCTVAVVTVSHKVYREVSRQAADEGSDLIVMGVHGRGAIDLLLFGSTTYHVIRAATVPVLTVRYG